MKSHYSVIECSNFCTTLKCRMIRYKKLWTNLISLNDRCIVLFNEPSASCQQVSPVAPMFQCKYFVILKPQNISTVRGRNSHSSVCCLLSFFSLFLENRAAVAVQCKLRIRDSIPLHGFRLRQGLSKYLVTGRGCGITWPRDTCSISEKYLVQKIFNASTCPNCWTLQPHSQVVVLKRPRHSLWPSWWQAQPHSRCSSSTISRTRSSGTCHGPIRGEYPGHVTSSPPITAHLVGPRQVALQHHLHLRLLGSEQQRRVMLWYSYPECGYQFSGIMPSNKIDWRKTRTNQQNQNNFLVRTTASNGNNQNICFGIK